MSSSPRRLLSFVSVIGLVTLAVSVSLLGVSGSFVARRQIEMANTHELPQQAQSSPLTLRLNSWIQQTAASHSNSVETLIHSLAHGVDTVATGVRAAHEYRVGVSHSSSSSSSSASVASVSSSSKNAPLPEHFRSLIGGGASFELSEAQKEAVLAAFATDPKALKMREQSPRFGPSTIQFEQDYYVGLAIACAIGIGIALLQLFCTGFYMFCRCCCWRYCLKKRSDWEKDGFPGYPTFWSKYWPVIFLCVFTALACAFAGVGLSYNSDLSRTFSSSNQEHGVGPLVLAVQRNMLSWLNRITATTDSITAQINDIADSIALPPEILTQTNALISEASTKKAKYGSNSFSVTANGTNWVCTVACSVISAAYSDAGTQFSADVVPVINDIDDTVNKIQVEYKDQSRSITNQIADATQQLNDAKGTAIDADSQKTTNDMSKNVNDGDTIRNAVFIALFSCVFVAPLLIGIGLVLRKGCPFRFTFCLGPFYMFIIWILFGLHWFLGLGIGDSCAYFDSKIIVATDLFKNEGSLGSVINACLTNTSLITALNLESELNFQESIKFPNVPTSDIVAKFALPALSDMGTALNMIDAHAFGFNEAQVINATINQMSTEPTITSGTHLWTRTDILNCQSAPSACYSPYYSGSSLNNVLSWQQKAYEGLQILSAIQNGVQTIRTDADTFGAHLANLQGLAVSTSTNLHSIEQQLDPIWQDVGRFRDLAYCYFIAEDFGRFKNTFCNNLSNSIAWITFSLFMIGLSCFGITWCSRWSAYRIQFKPKIAPAPFNEQQWMIQNGYAPPPVGGAAYASAQVQPQYDQGIEMADPHKGGDDGFQTTDVGHAIAVPPYEAAMASYKNPAEFADHAPSAPPAEEDGNHIEEAGQGSPVVCDSCETAQATISCNECDEQFCSSCDDTLHKSEANVGHTRNQL